MGSVPATEFKARCLELMDRVAEKRETFIITKRGKPIAKLVLLERQTREGIFGSLKGKAWIVGDIVGPVLHSKAWETIQEWDQLSAKPETKPRARKRTKP